jgi:hypothetical protein
MRTRTCKKCFKLAPYPIWIDYRPYCGDCAKAKEKKP